MLLHRIGIVHHFVISIYYLFEYKYRGPNITQSILSNKIVINCDVYHNWHLLYIS